ncbi:MAG: molybdenum cofactor guanylyltransferase [Anaerolineae bacterium]|nr:molybdenum cofactor guanylyltransferase [Anaerolineae bacterium]
MFSIVVQAGGQSRRLGQNKALVPFLGQPLISRVISRVSDLAEEILVTTNNPEDYPFLDIPLIPDIEPGAGALGGIYTAINTATHPQIAIVACDMPFVNANLLNAQHKMLLDSDADAVIPVSQKGLEPFHAVYQKETCLAALEQTIGRGEKRVQTWLDAINIIRVDTKEITQHDPEGIAFTNINRGDDLAKALRLATCQG